MSRISKNPVSVPAGVEYSQVDSVVSIKGPFGVLHQKIVDGVAVSFDNDNLNVSVTGNSKHSHAMSGTIRSLLSNMVLGVNKGFEKKLILVGVGYRAQVNDNLLVLSLGFSHVIDYKIPEGIQIKLSTPTEIVVSGIDKQRVGQVASEIRAYRKPEPYKGKGVRYSDEVIILKEAKKK